MSEVIAHMEEKTGHKIAKSQEEQAHEELMARSMETHTRKIIKLMAELKQAYSEILSETEDERERTIIRDEFKEDIKSIADIMDQNKPLDDKSFYY